MALLTCSEHPQRLLPLEPHSVAVMGPPEPLHALGCSPGDPVQIQPIQGMGALRPDCSQEAGFRGNPREEGCSRPLTVLQVDTSLRDFIQNLGQGAHGHTAFYPEDRAGGGLVASTASSDTCLYMHEQVHCVHTWASILSHMCTKTCIPKYASHTFPRQTEGETHTQGVVVLSTHLCPPCALTQPHIHPPILQNSKIFTHIYTSLRLPQIPRCTPPCTHTWLHAARIHV